MWSLLEEDHELIAGAFDTLNEDELIDRGLTNSY